MLSAGLGGMKPNTLILQYFDAKGGSKSSSNTIADEHMHRRAASSPFHRQQSYYEERAKDTLNKISGILNKMGERVRTLPIVKNFST